VYVDTDDDVYIELEMEDFPHVASSPTVPAAKAGRHKPVVAVELEKFRPPVKIKKLFDFGATSLSAIQQAYIMAYAMRGTKRGACELADVTARQVAEWGRSEEFNEWLAVSVGVVADTLEDELIKRAMEGSDKLLVKAVEAHKPDKYSPRQNISQHIVHSWADLARIASTSHAPTMTEIGEDADEEDEIEWRETGAEIGHAD